MRFFLRSKRFKIVCSVAAILIVVSIVIRLIGGSISPQSGVFGAIAQPFKSIAAYFSDKVSDFDDRLNNGQAILEENQKLKKRVDELSSQAVDYNKIKKENKFLKSFLELKDEHKDFKFEKASVISSDNEDTGLSFTINKGSVNGISQYDPVISTSGLIGYVTEVGPSFSNVTTILSKDINIGCSDYRTEDSGIVSGSEGLAKKNQCTFYNIPRSCAVALNDIVVTSGSSVFPDGLVVGTISSISAEKEQTSITATIDCSTKIKDVKDLMVITYFNGQGTLEDASK